MPYVRADALSALKAHALSMRAVEMGIDEAQVEAADEARAPERKAALVLCLLVCRHA